MKYILVYILLFVSTINAANFTVSNLSQFQTALNTAATNGENDTINVLGGTYNLNATLSFSSSENYFLLIRGVGYPVLNGGNALQVLQLNTTSNAAHIILEELVIQNGLADYGGGLNISTQGAQINIKNCVFNDNVAGFICGGANLFSNTGNITVTNCSFNRNSSPNPSGYPYGTAGGLFVQTIGSGTVITMVGCNFNQNSAHRDAAGAMLYPLGNNSTIIVEFNTFTNNIARESGGGCWIRTPAGNTEVRYKNNTLTGNLSQVAGNGGGTCIQITSGIINLFDNIHTGNYSIWSGGGMWIEHSGGTLNIYRNKFVNNTSGEAGGGANISLNNGVLKFDHNVFYKNRTLGSGGGLTLSTVTANLNVFNNTFYLNTSADGGDIYLYFDNPSSSSNFYNNILYNSSLPSLSYSGQQTFIARYSNIQGGVGQPWFGTGCIDLFPFFVDTAVGNFHLQDSIHCNNPRYSPCIDAGNPAVQDSILNCDWGLGMIRSDMGAYGGNYSTSIGIKKLNSNAPEGYYLLQNYPNPFNMVTKILFQIPYDHSFKSSKPLVIIKVFNILGKEVATLVNEELQHGSYEVIFDGSQLTSGVYFYKITTEDFTETKKMLLIK